MVSVDLIVALLLFKFNSPVSGFMYLRYYLKALAIEYLIGSG